MVGTKAVSIDGHIIIPIDPKWLYQFLAQDFWDRVSSMTEVAGKQAYWVWPKTREGGAYDERSPLTWVRRMAVMKRSAKGGRSDKVGYIEEYEDMDRRELDTAIAKVSKAS
jgi:hypothetical protein